jgi:hypothetical protein
MQEFGGWYFDLARRWDASYLHQGPPEPEADSYGGWDSSGVYLLAYAMPLKKIRLTGKHSSTIPQLDAAAAGSLIRDGRGWTNKDRTSSYDALTDDELLDRLRSWSPIVRERAAMALGRRGNARVPELVEMLASPSLDARYGAWRRARRGLRRRQRDQFDAMQPAARADGAVRISGAASKPRRARFMALPSLVFFYRITTKGSDASAIAFQATISSRSADVKTSADGRNGDGADNAAAVPRPGNCGDSAGGHGRHRAHSHSRRNHNHTKACDSRRRPGIRPASTAKAAWKAVRLLDASDTPFDPSGIKGVSPCLHVSHWAGSGHFHDVGLISAALQPHRPE